MLGFNLSQPLHAAIDPYYKDAIQRGYKLKGDSVVFTDGSMCLYQAFLDGTCGQQWMVDDYCVSEGNPVWDDDRCCEGLSVYRPRQADGQSTCEKLPDDHMKGKLSWVLWVFPGMLVLIGLFSWRVHLNNRKKRSQNT